MENNSNNNINSLSKDNGKKKSFRDIKTVHDTIRIIIITGWILLAVIFCYIVIIDYGVHKPQGSAAEIHWNIAIAAFIVILAFSFFLQTILIEKENKTDLRNKITHALNREHRNYFKKREKRNAIATNPQHPKSENKNEIKQDEKSLNDIIQHFGEENSHFLYQLYRQIQNLLIKGKEKQQLLLDADKNYLLVKDLGLNDVEVRSNAIRELSEFHIPDNILDYFIDVKIKRDGLALNSYILPLSFFLFVYFAGFLMILPLINSIFVTGNNHIVIPIFSFFPIDLGSESKDNPPGIPLLVIQWGFLGGLVYASIGLLNRFLRKDLPPRAYYNASFRLLLSGAAAIIIFLLYKTSIFSSVQHLSGQSMTYFVLLLCFSIGIAPIQFLVRSADIILSKSMKFWRHKDTAGKRSLTNIEGIDSITAERLSEEGFDYIQQLALCDPMDLSFKTKFLIDIVKDWKDQALLYLLTADIIVTKKDIIKKQNKQYLNYALNEVYGIRRFSQFYHLTDKIFKIDVPNEEIEKTDKAEKDMQDFCKGLGFIDSDAYKFRYIIESILKKGYTISEIYYKYDTKQFTPE